MSNNMKILDATPTTDHEVDNDTDVTALPADVLGSRSIALRFPKWTDGRAYSQARLLRTRLAFTGELRAVGDVVVDMLPLLERAGFDAAVLRADQKRSSADRVMRPFIAHYQADVHEPRPVYARALHTRAKT
jgi:uncharacterized protein (DUF934 family)